MTLTSLIRVCDGLFLGIFSRLRRRFFRSGNTLPWRWFFYHHPRAKDLVIVGLARLIQLHLYCVLDVLLFLSCSNSTGRAFITQKFPTFPTRKTYHSQTFILDFPRFAFEPKLESRGFSRSSSTLSLVNCPLSAEAVFWSIRITLPIFPPTFLRNS